MKVWGTDARASFTVPYLDLVRDRFGDPALRGWLARWAVTPEELRQETAWISQEFLDEFADAMVAWTGSEELLVAGSRALLDRRYLGTTRVLLQLFANPGALYRRMPQLSSTVNRVQRVVLVRSGRSSATLRYEPLGGSHERSPWVCRARKEQLASVPRVWGLPAARVEHPRCMHQGDSACEYELYWQRRTVAWGTLGGLALGGAAALVLGLGQSSGAVSALGGATLALAGRLLDARRARREGRRFAVEQNDALLVLLQDARERFARLRAAIDARERSERAQDRLELKLQQQQRLEAIGTLAGGLAHEVNNPLNVTMNCLELILDEVGPDTEAGQRATDAVACCGRIAGVVDNLLTFARQGQESLGFVDPAEVLRRAVELLGKQLLRDSIELEFVIPPGLAALPCRPLQLQQVFMNLLSNAQAALNERFAGASPLKRATLRAEERHVGGEHWLVVTLADQGCGMDDAVLERALEPFFSTRPRQEANGIGLSVSLGIIQAHGGRLSLASRAGEGTTATVELSYDLERVRQAAPAPDERAALAPQLSPVPASGAQS